MHNVGGLIETDVRVCIDCLQTQFWHNQVCYSDMKSPGRVKDEAQCCSVGKSETLGHTQEPFPPGFNTNCREESGTSVQQISVVLYRTRLSSAPSASPAFIWRTSIAGSWKCQCASMLSWRTAHYHQFTEAVHRSLITQLYLGRICWHYIYYTRSDVSKTSAIKQNVLCSRSVFSVIFKMLINFTLNPEFIFKPDVIFLIL